MNSTRDLKNEHQFFTNFSKRTKGKKLPNSFYEASATGIPKPKTSQRKNTSVFFMNVDAKKSSISSKPNTYKRIMHLTEWVFQECKTDLTSNNQSMSLIYNINGIRNKNLMILSLGTGKAFDKIQTLMEDSVEIP